MFQTTNQTKCIPMFHGSKISKPFLCHLVFQHAAVVIFFVAPKRIHEGEVPTVRQSVNGKTFWSANPRFCYIMNIEIFINQPRFQIKYLVVQPTEQAITSQLNILGGPPSTKYHHYWIPKSTVISVISPYNIPISNIPSYNQAVISYILYEIPRKTIYILRFISHVVGYNCLKDLIINWYPHIYRILQRDSHLKWIMI